MKMLKYLAVVLVLLAAIGGSVGPTSYVKADFSVSTEYKLLASDGATGDHFGYAVSVSGNTAVVGAYNKDSGRGAAYVYILSGSAWVQQAKLTAGNGASGDQFGCSVSISGDTVVVGASNETYYPDMPNAGAAYVFTRSGSVWSQQQVLLETGASFLSQESLDRFGFTVSVSGNTIVVGAPNKTLGSGAAYIFTRSGSTWSPQTALVGSDLPPNPWAPASFGYAVSLNNGTAIVGAPGVGAAYVFTGSGASWSQQAKLNGSDAVAVDLFGCSVSVNGDTAVVGATQKSSNAGACYVYTRSGTVWSWQQKLTAGDSAIGDYFGNAVSVSGDTAVIGANSKDTYKGAAYVFVRSGAVWSQQVRLNATDGANYNQFGDSVSVDGNNAVVGADWKSSGTGAAYVYQNVTSVPTGLLRVQTSPAVSTTISLNGIQRDDWALNWVKMPAESYSLSFSDVYGYSTPTSVTVNYYPGTKGNIQSLSSPIVISPDVVTEVIANFTLQGSLRVQTSPPMPATVYCNGLPMDDWGAWTNIAPGDYTISFQPVNGYTTPASQVATVTAGATTTITGTYVAGVNVVAPVAHGLLRVQTNPAVSTTISLNGIQRDDWALNWVQMTPGSYALSFSDVYNYATPTSVTVNYYPGTLGNVQALISPIVITDGVVTEVIANFTQLGSLRVETVTGGIPATIFCNGQPMDDWAFWTNILPGSYTISFQPVTGLLTPPPITVNVTTGLLTHVVGNYTLGTTQSI